jgi:hypothetical protein
MKDVNDMTPFEQKRWSALIDGVRLIDKTAKKQGINMADPKICQEYLKPKSILTYMEEVSSTMR